MLEISRLNTKISKMWYERELQNRIADLLGHFPVVILTGARQTGKTSLLKRLYPERHFVSLDLPSLAEEAESRPDEFLRAYPPPVTIDEVQYAPGLFRFLKIAVDQRRTDKGLFLLTGSQRYHLMRSLSETLAGRCAFLELHTLSATEFSQHTMIDGTTSLDFLLRGGYPELCAASSMPVADYFRGYVATYLERDVRNLVQVGNLRDFERFLRLAASRSACLLNMSELARDVGVAASTAANWVSVLEASGVVQLLEPYFENLGKRLVKTPKLYLMDTGLLCFLLGITSPEALVASPFLGNVWESFVFGQLVRGLQRTSSATTLWFWRDAHGQEVDFLLDAGERFSLVECKWTERPRPDDLREMMKVARVLSTKRSVECRIACRTPTPHLVADAAEAVNPFFGLDFI